MSIVMRRFEGKVGLVTGGASGIGLAISQHIARALGAAITFTSAPGVGSEFTLWLPRKP